MTAAIAAGVRRRELPLNAVRSASLRGHVAAIGGDSLRRKGVPCRCAHVRAEPHDALASRRELRDGRVSRREEVDL